MTQPEIQSKIDPETGKVFEKIVSVARKCSMQVYPVGGFVRDLILGKTCKDIDFVVVGNALDFIDQLYKDLGTSKPVRYPRFSTAMTTYKDYDLEFVTARTEYYDPDSRKPHVQTGTLESDLSRRDFTINTLALDITETGKMKLIDIFKGLKDIKSKIIRTPLDPAQTFSDDPLRMLRAIRFASTLGFSIKPKIFGAIKAAANRLEIISQERITDEFNKILLSEKPSSGLKLLEQSGLMTLIIPELIEAKGVEQKKEYHHKDVFYHTLQVIDQIALSTKKLELRLAALFHDIAKPRTKKFSEENGWTFHGHEIVGERMTGAILKKMKYSNDITTYVKKLVKLHLRPMALVSDEVSDSAIRRLLFLAGEDFDDLLTLCKADITSKNPQKVKKYLHNYDIVVNKAIDLEERDKLRSFKSPVDGNEIMKIFKLSPGRQVGVIKKFIEEAILEGDVRNEHDAALSYLLKHKGLFS